MKKNIQIFLFGITLFLFKSTSEAQEISKITVERHEVYDKATGTWFFAGDFLNSIHGLTKEHIITDEILLEEGDELDMKLLAETERNLRGTGFFTEAFFILDTLEDGTVHAHLRTQDKWSTSPTPIASYKAGIKQYGGRFTESNLFGYGTNIRLEIVNTNRNNTGWQADLALTQRRIFRTEMNTSGRLFANQFKTIENLDITKPYRTIAMPFAWNLSGANSYGSDFLFKNGLNQQIGFKEQFAQGWISQKFLRGDQLFISAYVSGKKAERQQRLAFDNSAKMLVAFSSLKQDFTKDRLLNSYQTEDIVTGGWGTVVLGKVIPITNGGDNMYYLGARAEQSVLTYRRKLYLFGQFTSGSGFGQGEARYIYQEAKGKTFYRFSDNSVISAQVRQQTSWNWTALRQLVLDNEAGLRGYAANQLSGDNRAITNVEYRYFAEFPILFFRFSGALFYDAGTVWNQKTPLSKTKWHHSAGPGLRFHTTTGGSLLLAADLPYNFDTKKFAPVLSSSYAFSIFDGHGYDFPRIFGEENDLD
ncbi:MAG: BamA/TamA family outer membrane protein [Bacteroidota bacterium]